MTVLTLSVSNDIFVVLGLIVKTTNSWLGDVYQFCSLSLLIFTLFLFFKDVSFCRQHDYKTSFFIYICLEIQNNALFTFVCLICTSCDWFVHKFTCDSKGKMFIADLRSCTIYKSSTWESKTARTHHQIAKHAFKL